MVGLFGSFGSFLPVGSFGSVTYHLGSLRPVGSLGPVGSVGPIG